MKKPIEGKEALDLLEQANRRMKASQEADLAEEKAKAVVRGKEEFDLERFEAMYRGRLRADERPREQRLAAREYDYYVLFADVMTIEEFAKALWNTRDSWDGP